jgi:hypothetical protein
MRALNISIHLPVTDDRACDLLGTSDYVDLVEAAGLDVQGAVDIEAHLDAESIQFIGETAWEMFSRASDPKKALADLAAWARDPFGPSYADLRELLIMEVAQSMNLTATLDCSVTVDTVWRLRSERNGAWVWQWE